MSEQPKISVLIPTYNYAHYIDEAIQSVLNQTFSNFELIIVDDQSSDNTAAIVQKYLSDSRVKFIVNPVNLGLVGNFNKSLEYATGEYIKYLMADDKLDHTLLARYAEILDKYPNVSLVTAGSATFGGKVVNRQPVLTGMQKGTKVIAACLKNGKGNWIGEPTVVMFRKSSLPVQKFNPDYICLVDLDMWFRLLLQGDCYIIAETLAYFRVHEKQASDRKKIRNWFDEYYFYRDIKKNNVYKVALEEINIDDVVKRKAKKCVKRTINMLPEFYKKGNPALIMEAVKIGLVEHVIW
ncbi:MAG: glycosyltransferase [Chitinophagaceae bacterium]|nr:MAG: glycosyltransferase [Chitinophagaceae bacterium]